MKNRRFVAYRSLLTLATVLTALFCSQPAWAAKNVILMIADGSGHNAWLAAGMYQGKAHKQTFDQPGWLHLGCTTYPLNRSVFPTGNNRQNEMLVYSPQKAWDANVQSDNPGDFVGYQYLKLGYTDSAAAGTALSTGRKTYDSAINWSNENKPFRGQTIAEIAKLAGKSAGVITTVPWSHATPATLGGAHNIFRNNYDKIANEMLDSDWLSVIMGAGHPDFNNDGKPIPQGRKHDYHYVGGEKTWNALKQGQRDWKLIESKADFEAMTSGATPAKVVGTVQTASTLQENRGRVALKGDKDRAIGASEPASKASEPELPFTTPFNPNVPSLATMTRAAINCLDDNPNGFYLMIEGGAIDWANHGNLPARMIEEQIAFNDAIEAVVAWIESHGGWDDTLLILTADHETGLLWGAESQKIAFQPLEDRGPGKMPGVQYNSKSHSNSLVPLYARGPGSERFSHLTKGKDATAGEKWLFSGDYVDNTAVFQVMQAEVTAKKN